MRSLFASLVPAVLRHLEAYAEVAAEDTREAAVIVARKLAMVLVAAVAALVSVLMFCAWLLALAWDGPWRNWVAGGLALGFALLAVALALPVLRPRAAPAFFARTRLEFGRDRDLLERTFDGQRGRPNGGDDEHAPH
jgi:uncharacterized membrane protein YqjE